MLNGLLLSVYFIFFNREEQLSNRLLGFMFLALTVRIGKSVLLVFTEHLDQHFVHIGLVACLTIGPLLFLYLKTLYEKTNQLTITTYLHFLPALILLVFSFFWGYWEHRQSWGEIVTGIRTIWLVYLVLSFVILRQLLKEKRQDRTWLISISVCVFLVWLAYSTNRFTSYIVGALTFSVLIYCLILLAFIQLRKSGHNRSRRSKKQIESADETLEAKLKSIMLEKQFFTNSNATMPDLAKELAVTPHFLSQYLNDVHQMNFSQFINAYRVDFAAEQIRKSNHLSVEAIAYESGFNSLSTFYNAFKTIKKMTPASYKTSGQ
ncbi:MAG: AraC family transcriptional regulator [Calditrichaeota bacterium]|nr:AraC family transcriptional regulator [Calditrichota bacterium]